MKINTNVWRLVVRLVSQPILWLFVVMVTVFGVMTPQFFTFQTMINVLIQSSSLAIIAIGMTFVLITAGIDLSVGSVMFISAVISGKMVVEGGISIWLACLLVLATGIVFGYINAFFVYRLRLIPFIVTLATYFVGRGLGLYISQTRAINLPDSFTQIGSARIFGIPFPILILLVVLIVSHIFLTYTSFGRNIYAVGEDKEKARRAGISINKILIGVYVICGFCAALGGFVAVAQLGAVSPTFGFQREFMAIAAAVLGGTSLFGGKGKIFPGTILGAILIQTMESGLVMVSADPYLHPVVTGGVLFLIVMIDSLVHKGHFTSQMLKEKM